MPESAAPKWVGCSRTEPHGRHFWMVGDEQGGCDGVPETAAQREPCPTCSGRMYVDRRCPTCNGGSKLADELARTLRVIATNHYSRGDHDAARVILDALENAQQDAPSPTQLTPQQVRDVEKALLRWTELHDDDCKCGPCAMLRARSEW